MMPKGASFTKKLYSLCLTYLLTDKFKYTLKMNMDNRSSFTELVHTENCGQVSVNILKPAISKDSTGATQKGNSSLWSLVTGFIQERNINRRNREA